MQVRQLTMQHKEGLRATNAARFVQVKSMFSSAILVEKDEKKVDAKSNLGMLVLDIRYQDTVMVYIDGDDENEAAAAIEVFF